MLRKQNSANQNLPQRALRGGEGEAIRTIIENMFTELKKRNSDPIHVSAVLTKEMFRYFPGDPYAKLPDESDIHAGLYCLSPMVRTIENRVKAYFKALDRLQLKRMEQLAEKWGCTVEEAAARWVSAQCEKPSDAPAATE